MTWISHATCCNYGNGGLGTAWECHLDCKVIIQSGNYVKNLQIVNKAKVDLLYFVCMQSFSSHEVSSPLHKCAP